MNERGRPESSIPPIPIGPPPFVPVRFLGLDLAINSISQLPAPAGSPDR